MSFQEEKQKLNYKCWRWNNKWKQNKFLNLSNKNYQKKMPKKNNNKQSILYKLWQLSQLRNQLRFNNKNRLKLKNQQLLIRNQFNKKKPKRKQKKKLRKRKNKKKQNSKHWNKNRNRKKNQNNKCWFNNNNKKQQKNKRKPNWLKNLSKNLINSVYLWTKNILSRLWKQKMKWKPKDMRMFKSKSTLSTSTKNPSPSHKLPIMTMLSNNSRPFPLPKIILTMNHKMNN